MLTRKPRADLADSQGMKSMTASAAGAPTGGFGPIGKPPPLRVPTALERSAPFERRRDERKPTARMTAKLFEAAELTHLLQRTVTVIDLSLRGVGLRSEHPLTIGTLYGLELRGNFMNLSSRHQLSYQKVLTCGIADQRGV